MDNDTIFDKILRGELEAKKVYEDEHICAFHDINPAAPVHLLVIPQTKMRNFIDVKNASPAVCGEFMQGIAKVAEQAGLEADGYRVVFNIGKNGQQSVDYIHAHIIGGRQLAWPPG